MELLSVQEIVEIHQQSKICGLYFLFQSGKIVYIGVSTDVVNRVPQHKSDKVFDRVRFVPMPEAIMYELEKRYIEKYKPMYNRTHNSDFKKRKWMPVEKKDKLQQIEEWMQQGKEMWQDFKRKQP